MQHCDPASGAILLHKLVHTYSSLLRTRFSLSIIPSHVYKVFAVVYVLRNDSNYTRRCHSRGNVELFSGFKSSVHTEKTHSVFPTVETFFNCKNQGSNFNDSSFTPTTIAALLAKPYKSLINHLVHSHGLLMMMLMRTVDRKMFTQELQLNGQAA